MIRNTTRINSSFCIAIRHTTVYHESGTMVNSMAIKNANVVVRVEPDIKEKAEAIFETLGIPASTAINMFIDR